MRADWFAGRLRELRAAAALTQTELGLKAGLSSHAIANWERGIREPSWGNVLALCLALGVGPEAFAQEPANAPMPRPGRPRRPD